MCPRGQGRPRGPHLCLLPPFRPYFLQFPSHLTKLKNDEFRKPVEELHAQPLPPLSFTYKSSLKHV